jgi:type IX secretion system PorP/SprF family membrane protein
MKKSTILFLFINMCFVAGAQDFLSSQFYELPMLRNPALVGIMPANIRATALFRDQWSSITVPYRTGSLSVESKIPIGKQNDFISFGMHGTRDQAGDAKFYRTQAYLASTFHKALSADANTIPNYLSFSVMGGSVWSGFDPTKMTFDDQFVGGAFNPGNLTSTFFTNTRINYFDLSSGLSFVGQTFEKTKYYIGVAGFHLARSKVNFFRDDAVILKRRFVVNGALSIQTGQNDRFTFYGDINFQGGNRQVLLGVLKKWNLGDYLEDDEEQNSTSISAGAAFRWGDAFIPVVKFYNKGFSAAVSYDMNISKLKSVSQTVGGFEVSMGYSGLLNIIRDRKLTCSNLVL